MHLYCFFLLHVVKYKQCYVKRGDEMQKSIRIAIVDDDGNAGDFILKCLKNSTNDLRMQSEIHLFSSADSFLLVHNNTPFQVVFLDICMPDMDGFALSKQLRDDHQDILIVYITTNEHLVFDSFDYQPFQFIRKREPETMQKEIIQTLQKIRRHITQIKSITLVLPYDEQISVHVQDIEAIVSELHYLVYYLKDGTYLRCRGKLSEVEIEMANYDFIQIHRSYLVNLKNVTQLIPAKHTVKLRSGKTLELGRKYEKTAAGQYKSYLRTLI